MLVKIIGIVLVIAGGVIALEVLFPLIGSVFGMAFLLAHLPAHLHLVIASRSQPPLPLSLWRGRGAGQEWAETPAGTRRGPETLESRGGSHSAAARRIRTPPPPARQSRCGRAVPVGV